MTEQPNHHDGHLTVYVAWPILAGLGVGAVLALQLADLGALVAEWLTYERTFNQAAPATVDTYAKGLQAFGA